MEDMLNMHDSFSSLKDVIAQVLPEEEFELLIYGSAINGLCVRGGDSDLDLSLLVKRTINEDDLYQQQLDENEIL